ncbi:hypothetical protein BsWGS_06323 [Bradybaena similaris]
MLISKLS